MEADNAYNRGKYCTASLQFNWFVSIQNAGDKQSQNKWMFPYWGHSWFLALFCSLPSFPHPQHALEVASCLTWGQFYQEILQSKSFAFTWISQLQIVTKRCLPEFALKMAILFEKYLLLLFLLFRPARSRRSSDKVKRLSLVHASCRLQQLLQRARLLQIIGFFSIFNATDCDSCWSE